MGVINLGILVKKIMGKIAGAGYIKNDDYASSTTGGTIKVDSTYATEVTSGGKLKAKEITAEAYSEANDAAFISKATLDNVLATQTAGVTIEKIYDKIPTYPAAAAEDASVSGKTFAGYTAFIVGMEAANGLITALGLVVPSDTVSGSNKAELTIGSTTFTLQYGGTDNDKMWITTSSQLTKKLRIWGVK